ncbi:Uncharacterised protein [Mycobacteroides abscessus subsp. massiliense]|nr:Uncharacterised protein [Mycobacteroides abscessus subsp. massiliense]
MGRLATRPHHHRPHCQAHGDGGPQAHLRVGQPQGRRRRHHPQQLQGPVEPRQGRRPRQEQILDGRCRHPARRSTARGQRADRNHRQGPAAHGGSVAAGHGCRVVLRLRRCDRGRPAADGRWSYHRRRPGHHAVGHALRPRALLRPARGHADRPRYCHRLFAVHREPVPRRDRGRLRHRNRGASHRDHLRPHRHVLGDPDRRGPDADADRAAAVPAVTDLCGYRLGAAGRDLGGHRAARVPRCPRAPRRCIEYQAVQSHQIARRAGERLLGTHRRVRHAASARVRRADRHRDAAAHHSAGQPQARRVQ